MKIVLIQILLLILFHFPGLVVGQDTIMLKNPSFEDEPRQGGTMMIPIEGWRDCGRVYFPEESPPHVQPLPSGGWEVKEKAQEGDTYLRMVVRHNETW